MTTALSPDQCTFAFCITADGRTGAVHTAAMCLAHAAALRLVEAEPFIVDSFGGAALIR
jgi:hypothetical protein